MHVILVTRTDFKNVYFKFNRQYCDVLCSAAVDTSIPKTAFVWHALQKQYATLMVAQPKSCLLWTRAAGAFTRQVLKSINALYLKVASVA
jgi:hypothetical protein